MILRTGILLIPRYSSPLSRRVQKIIRKHYLNTGSGEQKVIEFNSQMIRYLDFLTDYLSRLIGASLEFGADSEHVDQIWTSIVNTVAKSEGGSFLYEVWETDGKHLCRSEGARRFILAHEFAHFFINDDQKNLLKNFVRQRWGSYFSRPDQSQRSIDDWAEELHSDIFAMRCLVCSLKDNPEKCGEHILGAFMLMCGFQITEFSNPYFARQPGFAPWYDFSTHPPASVRRHWMRIILGSLDIQLIMGDSFKEFQLTWATLRSIFENAPFGFPPSQRRKNIRNFLTPYGETLAKRLDTAFVEVPMDILNIDSIFPSQNEVLFHQMVLNASHRMEINLPEIEAGLPESDQ